MVTAIKNPKLACAWHLRVSGALVHLHVDDLKDLFLLVKPPASTTADSLQFASSFKRCHVHVFAEIEDVDNQIS